MHHYTAYTCSTMTDNPILAKLWKEIVPQYAFQHRFLLQGLLALAAQHKIHLAKGRAGPDPGDLGNIPELYRQEALMIYMRLLSDITEENCHALFAFSQVILAIWYSRLSLDLNKVTWDPQLFITGVVDIFDLLKGALAIAEEAEGWIRAGPLEAMMNNGPPPALTEFNVSTPWTWALSALSGGISSSQTDIAPPKGQLDVLQLTIAYLYTLFLEGSESVDKFNKVIGFPAWLDTGFTSLLKARDDASLAVLAYYGLALHQIAHVWCLDNIGASLVKAAAALISPQWSIYLDYPQAVIRGEELNI